MQYEYMATDRSNAIIALIRDARTERTSKASLARVNRALRKLGLTNGESGHILSVLDYAREDGELYDCFKTK